MPDDKPEHSRAFVRAIATHDTSSSSEIDNLRRDLLRQAQAIIEGAGVSFHTDAGVPNTLVLIGMARALKSEALRTDRSPLFQAAVRAVEAAAVYQGLLWGKAKPQELARAAVDIGRVATELDRLAEKASGAAATAAKKRKDKAHALEVAKSLWANRPSRSVKAFSGDLREALATAGIVRRGSTIETWVRDWSREGIFRFS